MENKIVVVLAMLAFLAAPLSAMDLVEVREVQPSFFSQPFSVFTDRSVYNVGEVAVFTDDQDIYAQCDNLRGTFTIKDFQANQIDYLSRDLGVAGYLTVHFRLTKDTSALSPKRYQLLSRWFCRVGGIDYELGGDGAIDSNTVPTTAEFEVVNIPRGSSATPPVQTCNLACSPGYELINPSSPYCQCQYNVNGNNGVCELGEFFDTPDCRQQQTCPASQKLLDGQCVSFCADGKTLLSIDSSGASSCDKPAGLSFDLVVGAGIVLLLAGGALWLVKRK